MTSLSSFKNFTLFKPRTKYVCKKCKCSYAVEGDTWLYNKRSTPAVDGSKAYRIYWFCHNGHKKYRGYSRPVSWKKNLGGDITLGGNRFDMTFAEEEEEIEKEWKQLEEYAKKYSQGGNEKKFF